jgi:hypothetical protein
MVGEECKKYIKKVLKINKEKKAKKLSAYNVFSKETRENMEGSPKEIMTKWKKSKEVEEETRRVRIFLFPRKVEELPAVEEVEEEDEEE